MTRPDWCPEDVWRSTDDVGEAVYGRHERGFVMWPLTDAETLRPAIARAILAERKACAQVAVKTGDSFTPAAMPHAGGMGRVIASAIRTRSAP